MSDIQLATQSGPTTPAAGNSIVFVDTNAEILCYKNAAGRYFGRSTNTSTAADGSLFAVETWVIGSDLKIPSFSMQAKSMFLWRISASKTGASTATPIYNILTGSNRSTADTKRLTLTGPAQTAVADIGTLNIMVTCRLASSIGVIQGTAWWDHRGTAANTTTSGTGFANDTTGHVEGTSGTFDNTALGGLYISLSMNGGAASTWTLTQVQAECDW
jgi:hypothetical protein